MNTDCTTLDNVVFDTAYVQKNTQPDLLDSVLKLSDGAFARPVRSLEVCSATTAGFPVSWEIVVPSTANTDQTYSQQKKAVNQWSILSFAAVCEFCELRKGYDLDSMQHIFELVSGEFSGYSAQYELSSDEDGNPELILRVDAQNLSMQELIEKELRVFEVIARSVTLSNTNKYNIISIA